MIIFDGVSATVLKPNTGDVVIFQTSKDYYGKVRSVVVYNTNVSAQDSLVTRLAYDSYHNFGVRAAGFDTNSIFTIEGESLRFNRYFCYAPFGGIYVSTMPDSSARYIIQSIADNKEQYDTALNLFKSSDLISMYKLDRSATNSNTSYSIYKGV